MRVLSESERRRGVLRASGKAVWTWPPVVAVDAGAMQIQSWEGAVLTCAETMVQSAIHDTMRGKAGCRENVQRQVRLKEGEEGI